MNYDYWPSETDDPERSRFTLSRLSIPPRLLTLLLLVFGAGLLTIRRQSDESAQSAGENVISVHSDQVRCVCFSRDGHFLAWTGAEGTTATCMPARGRDSAVFKYQRDNAKACCVAFSPVCDSLATGFDDGTVELREPIHASPDRNFEAHDGAVRSLAFSPDGSFLVTGGLDSRVKVWNVSDLSQRATLGHHAGEVACVVFDRSGKRIASAGNDGKVVIWDAATAQETATFLRPARSAQPPRCVAFSPDGAILVASYQHAGVVVWNVASRQVEPTRDGSRIEVRSVAFSADGKTLAVAAANGSIGLWDSETLKQVAILRGHLGGIYSVAFSPDGRFLASGGWDHTVRLWPLGGQEVASQPLSSVDVAEDADFFVGQAAALAHDNTLPLMRQQPFDIASNLDAVSPSAANPLTARGHR